MKKVVILGSSGSIGQNVLEVIRNLPGEFQIVCLTAHQNVNLLLAQALEFNPRVVVISGSRQDSAAVARLRARGIEVLLGEEELSRVVFHADFDLLVNALVGAVGLMPTLQAIRKGKTVALANKETLVMAGEIITAEAESHGARLLPVDSEHSAIFQCLVGENIEDVRRIILTGSGGPFYGRKLERFDEITVEEALAHPNWKMGKKITVDSATLMNKGLEIIEAHWLFGLPLQKIDLVIHPQSVIHSLVEFVDGSIKAQLGWPDMRIPIQYALTYPSRKYLEARELDFAALGKLTFLQPDFGKFPALKLALDAVHLGGTAPAVLNAANEEAVSHFLARHIPFTSIPLLIARALEHHQVISHPSLEQILLEDRLARKYVRQWIRNGKVAKSRRNA